MIPPQNASSRPLNPDRLLKQLQRARTEFATARAGMTASGEIGFKSTERRSLGRKVMARIFDVSRRKQTMRFQLARVLQGARQAKTEDTWKTNSKDTLTPAQRESTLIQNLQKELAKPSFEINTVIRYLHEWQTFVNDQKPAAPVPTSVADSTETASLQKKASPILSAPENQETSKALAAALNEAHKQEATPDTGFNHQIAGKVFNRVLERKTSDVTADADLQRIGPSEQAPLSHLAKKLVTDAPEAPASGAPEALANEPKGQPNISTLEANVMAELIRNPRLNRSAHTELLQGAASLGLA